MPKVFLFLYEGDRCLQPLLFIQTNESRCEKETSVLLLLFSTTQELKLKLSEDLTVAAKEAKPEENRKWYTYAQWVMGVYHHHVLSLLLNHLAVSPDGTCWIFCTTESE